MSAYSNGAAKFHIEAKRCVMQRFSRLSFLPSFAEGHGCKPVDECEVGTLRSLGEGGYASEGSARRSVWRGATAVRPWGSTSFVSATDSYLPAKLWICTTAFSN